MFISALSSSYPDKNSDPVIRAMIFTHTKIRRLNMGVGIFCILLLLAIWVYTDLNKEYSEHELKNYCIT